MWISVKSGQSVKRLWIISQNNFPFTSRYPPETRDRFQHSDSFPRLHQTLVNFTVSSPGYWQNGCLWCLGSRLMISFGIKVIFCIEKQFHWVLTWSDYSMDKCTIWIADETDMTPLQVRYPWGKYLPQTKSGTPSTIVYTPKNSRH